MKYPGLLQLAALAIVAGMIPAAEQLMDTASGCILTAAMLGTAWLLLCLSTKKRRRCSRELQRRHRYGYQQNAISDLIVAQQEGDVNANW